MNVTGSYDWANEPLARPQKFNEHQLFVIPLAGRVTSILSVIGTISLIIAYTFFPRTRKTGSRPVIFMCLSSCLAATATTFGRLFIHLDSRPLCTLQAFTFQTFYLAGVCWSGAVAISLILVVRFRVDPSDLGRYERWYHLACWGIPGTISIVYLTAWKMFGRGRVFGDATFWCWITDAYPELRVYVFFIPMWVIFLFNISTYSYVGITLWRTKKRLAQAAHGSDYYSSNTSSVNVSTVSYPPSQNTQSGASASAQKTKTKWDQTVRRYVQRTAIYLIAFIITWTPGTVNRIQNLLYPSDPWYWLFVVHAIFLPGGGFIESIIYFYPNIKEACQKRRETKDIRRQRKNSTVLVDTDSRSSSQRSLTRTKDVQESLDPTIPRSPKSKGTYPLYAVSVSDPMPPTPPDGFGGMHGTHHPNPYGVYHQHQRSVSPPPSSPLPNIPPPPRHKSPPASPKSPRLKDHTYKVGWRSDTNETSSSWVGDGGRNATSVERDVSYGKGYGRDERRGPVTYRIAEDGGQTMYFSDGRR
ncbi:hypothetical protein HK097_010439 [Rhizophlyctis rosea]|uniref:G-protein coupled receptors family 2 profile 2 domain-containing protein n=1 Tax=Rhizophlyctis rosea TaxID=64517 RepID=A0AAD5S9X4_9FUNG|nr:hypothetical protein HK097_010439 [Rhizophlyctis rosea]